MQKLRQLYTQTQNNAKNNFEKVTAERCKKILAFANKEYETSIAQNDFTNLEEIAFYQQKFSIVTDKLNNAANDKTKKPKLQSDILNALSENYIVPGVIHNTPQSQYNQNSQRAFNTEEKLQRTQQKKPGVVEELKPVQNKLDPKDMLSSYFEMKKTQIQRSKIGFKSVLQNIPKTSQKYAIKSSIQARKSNDEDILKYKKQIDDLTKKLQQSKMQTKLASEFRQGIVEAEKQQYQARIEDLVQRIGRLNRENQKLKYESVHQVTYAVPPSKATVTSSIVEPMNFNKSKSQLEKYDPFTINYRSNNMFQLNQKHQSISHIPHGQNYNLNRKENEKSPKASQQEILLKAFPQHYVIDHPRYESQFEKSNLKFNKSEIQNEQRNIIIRSKLSFFKSSMVLYRSEQFQIALKSHDIIPLESRRITIYVNNKDKFQRKVQLSYNYDPLYYELTLNKKLSQVDGLHQGKEQIEVRLKNRNDLDSLIQAKFSINNKAIKFIIPTMMIEFTTDKPSISSLKLQKKVVTRPMYQFSNIFSAMEILPLDKYYEDMAEVGRVYARSKYQQGFIYMRWKGRNELQIETIKPWILFLSYLMIKDY